MRCLVRSRPDAHLAALDQLLEKRNRGELVDHIAALANEKCQRSNALLIAAPIGALAGLALALLVAHWFGRRGIPVAGVVGIPSLVMAALLLSWSFRHATGWQAIHPVTFLIAVGMFAALVSMILDVGMPRLQQRAFLFLLLLWLSVVVDRVVRVDRSGRVCDGGPSIRVGRS